MTDFEDNKPLQRARRKRCAKHKDKNGGSDDTTDNASDLFDAPGGVAVDDETFRAVMQRQRKKIVHSSAVSSTHNPNRQIEVSVAKHSNNESMSQSLLLTKRKHDETNLTHDTVTDGVNSSALSESQKQKQRPRKRRRLNDMEPNIHDGDDVDDEVPSQMSACENSAIAHTKVTVQDIEGDADLRVANQSDAIKHQRLVRLKAWLSKSKNDSNEIRGQLQQNATTLSPSPSLSLSPLHDQQTACVDMDIEGSSCSEQDQEDDANLAQGNTSCTAHVQPSTQPVVVTPLPPPPPPGQHLQVSSSNTYAQPYICPCPIHLNPALYHAHAYASHVLPWLGVNPVYTPSAPTCHGQYHAQTQTLCVSTNPAPTANQIMPPLEATVSNASSCEPIRTNHNISTTAETQPCVIELSSGEDDDEWDDDCTVQTHHEQSQAPCNSQQQQPQKDGDQDSATRRRVDDSSCSDVDPVLAEFATHLLQCPHRVQIAAALGRRWSTSTANIWTACEPADILSLPFAIPVLMVAGVRQQLQHIASKPNLSRSDIVALAGNHESDGTLAALIKFMFTTSVTQSSSARAGLSKFFQSLFGSESNAGSVSMEHAMNEGQTLMCGEPYLSRWHGGVPDPEDVDDSDQKKKKKRKKKKCRPPPHNLCMHFNLGECNREKCRFTHQCLGCGRNQPWIKCNDGNYCGKVFETTMLSQKNNTKRSAAKRLKSQNNTHGNA